MDWVYVVTGIKGLGESINGRDSIDSCIGSKFTTHVTVV